MTDAPLLDGPKIAGLSRAARLSRRKLATMIGVSQTAIKSIETGRNHDELNGRHLRLLADALGVKPAELFAAPPAAPPATNDDHLIVPGIVLAAPGGISAEAIALALQWTLDRVDRALRSAQATLVNSGLRLIEAPAHSWQLRPASSAAIREPPDDLTTELDRNTMQLAARIRRYEMTDRGRTLSTDDQASLAHLVALGLATVDCRWTGPHEQPDRPKVVSLQTNPAAAADD